MSLTDDTKTQETTKKRRERHSVRRINRIAELAGARAYLEIGVSKGNTFHALEFPRKVAVDPLFRFETVDHQKPGVEFLEIPSDAFFTEHAPAAPFDIIFLDGLHTFRQTLRDFLNSLSLSHERTVWLIDDVLPIDEPSALPDEQECLRRRRELGDPSRKWHGDVYKVMYFIHDFLPVFSFVSPNTGGNAQSIVWKAPRHNFSPALGTMEAIEQLSYSGMLERRSVLNLCPEEDAFETFLGSLQAQRSAQL